MTDLDEAIEDLWKALEELPEGHPDRGLLLNGLGVGLRTRFERTRDLSSLDEAIRVLQLALSTIPGDITTYEASSTAVRLIPKLTPRSLETSDKQRVLGEISGLASDAAAAALHAGKGPTIALELLELGRGVLTASLEELRADTLALRREHLELEALFTRLQGELDFPLPGNTPLTGEEDSRQASASDTRATRRYEAGRKLDELVMDIRKLPGFEDFLLVPTEGDARAAAKCGPIVTINVSGHRCDAIVVEQLQIRAVALPGLNLHEIEEISRKGSLVRPEVLGWLWDVVVRPVLDAVRLTQPVSNDDWPHVWWIPTGLLRKFPLHAAGHHRNGYFENALDMVMSSYSSSVKSIIHGRRRPITDPPPSTPAKALLIAMEHTQDHGPLIFAEKEIAILCDVCKSLALDPIRPGRCKRDVLAHLPDCRVFHFAGHVHNTDSADPSQSYPVLEDWESDRLTVAALLEMSLREQPPFLAYLSACGTGRVNDERFSDESIHLISAFQLAGFRHVIGTLWEVRDELCVDMARITYEGMMGGMTDYSVCLGLHKAARRLRDRSLDMPTGLQHLEHYDWVPYVHFGV